jgi:predicted AlkP superfamily phosphohydrolase/phosphomutase
MARKVVLVGLDSITPVMVERFLAEGRMPNLQRMRERGFSSEVTPTMPPTTPAGWTTVATGAWPSTHGVEGFAVHVEGDPLDKKVHGTTAERCRAEYVWQVAERAGRRTIILKFPLTWPPTGGERVLQVDGAGGWGGMKCVWDLAHSGCWDTHAAAAGAAGAPDGAAAMAQEWMTRDADNLDEESVQPLRVVPPSPWTGLPAGAEPRWETRLELRSAGAAEAVPIHALAVRLDGRDAVLLSPSRDGSEQPPLAGGRWSEWIRMKVPTRDGVHHGHVRLKVTAFDLEARRLRLYQTQCHSEDGYTRPERAAGALLEAAGPFVEWTESYDRLQDWIDDDTQLEIYEQHAEWMARAAGHLMANEPWDLFLTQLHFLDMAYHMYWGAVDPGHPDHDPERAPYYWELLGRAHELADRVVGSILERVDDETLVLVMGEHGQDLYHTSFMANHLLIRDGLLVPYLDPRTGAARIDWTRSRAYASSYRIYLNVAGREPTGIVTGDEYRPLQDRIVEALYGAADAAGRHPVRLAVRREDARSIGLYGGSMGDVVFAVAPGFQTRSTVQLPPEAWAARRLRPERVPLFRPTRLFQEFTGEHDTSLPYTRSIRTLLFAQGPGVEPAPRDVPLDIVDVCPTMCEFLGIPFPAQCEGAPIRDLLRA